MRNVACTFGRAIILVCDVLGRLGGDRRCLEGCRGVTLAEADAWILGQVAEQRSA